MQSTRKSFRPALLLFCIAIVACSNADFGGAPAVKTEQTAKTKGSLSLEVAPKSATVNVGKVISFVATLVTDGKKKKDVTKSSTWKVSSAQLAEIDKDGTFTAKAAGQVDVTARFEEEEAVATITIADSDLLSIRVSPAEKTIAPNDSVAYEATGVRADGSEEDLTKRVAWRTEDALVAAFDSDSVKNQATGLAAGTVGVIASLDGMDGSAKLEVKNLVLDRLAITPQTKAVAIGVLVPYTATAYFSDDTNQDVTSNTDWFSEKNEVATFSTDAGSKHVAKALLAGTTAITAKYQGVIATAELTVNAATVVAVAITPATATIDSGNAQQYAATATFSDGSTADVTKTAVWSSTDATIATIANDGVNSGKATGVKGGTTKIHAVYESVEAAQVTLTVVDPPPSKFTLTVTKAGNGGGTVVSDVGGVSCGNDCVKAFDPNTAVVLTANGDANSTFTGWTGACSGMTCTVSMTAAKAVAATFTKKTFALTVAKTGGGTGSVGSAPAGISCGNDCTEVYAISTNVTLTATPDADSLFGGWTGACTGTTCVVAMSAAKSVTATFNKKTFTLTVAKAGAGTGSVASNPAGITCGNDCNEPYVISTNVTLTATPDADSTFTGWTGDCSGASTCSVAMSAAKAVTATFAKKNFALTVAKAGTGTGSVASNPAGIACGNDCTEPYVISTNVTLTATADADSTFTGWTGDCSGTSTCAVAMTAAKSVTATFTKKSFALTVAKAGAGTGSVASNPAGITCGSDCSETYLINTNVTLTATPDADSTFTGWTGDCSGASTCSVAMSAAKAVTATFAKKSFALTVAKAGTGTGSVASNPAGIACGNDCTEPYVISTNVTLTATPDADSTFAGWSGDCSGISTCSVTMSAAKSVTATFTKKTFALTVTKAGVGAGTVASNPTGVSCGSDCTEIYAINTSVTLTATAGTGSVFAGWSGACSGTSTCTVSVTEAKAVTATFDVNCTTNLISNANALFKTPLVDKPYSTGDMNRRDLDGHPDKHLLQDVVTNRCVANSQQWADPVVSADLATRTAVCKLYGYAAATANFGYYGLASPTNNHAASWNATAGKMAVNYDASKSPTSNKILVWTECQGQIYDSCKNTFVNDFKCQP